jgi:cadmium resistance protein CadD (predicted permease)
LRGSGRACRRSESLTIDNGGDNLGAYIPLFASDVAHIPLYVTIFGILTALRCVLGHAIVRNRFTGPTLRR